MIPPTTAPIALCATVKEDMITTEFQFKFNENLNPPAFIKFVKAEGENLLRLSLQAWHTVQLMY